MSFKKGDKAVYPVHGVGVIEAIETKEICGNKQSFYILRILNNDMTIMVPTNNAQKVGLREIISVADVPRVYRILSRKDVEVESQTWNRRHREYTEKLKTGSVFEVAEVLRDLYLLKNGKDLSFGERRMLDTAKGLLVKEISVAKNINEDKVERELNLIFLVKGA